MNKSDFFTADAVKPHFTYDDYCESADMIAAHLGDFRPEVLLVLGSGLGFLGDRVEARTCVSYADIPHFRASTAPGHEGRFVFGELRGKRAAVIGLAADAPAEADFLREIGCDVQYYDGKKHRFEIRGAERADTLVVDGAAQPADVIFVLRAGFAADTLLPGIATEKGHIVVDESYAASIPGVFAAGDCTGAPYQIPAAVGEGNRAALSVVRWLRNA